MRRARARGVRTRGQTALEFIILFGFMLFVFTAFFYVMRERSALALAQSRHAELRTVGEIITQEVSTANRVKDGYARTFELPATLSAGTYTISLYGDSEVVIETTDEEYLVFLPTNITTTGIMPGKNTISKKDGIITITPDLLEEEVGIIPVGPPTPGG